MKSFVFFSHAKIGVMNHSMKGIGKILPARQIGIALSMGMSSIGARISPPLSSMSGSIDTTNMISSFGSADIASASVLASSSAITVYFPLL